MVEREMAEERRQKESEERERSKEANIENLYNESITIPIDDE